MIKLQYLIFSFLLISHFSIAQTFQIDENHLPKITVTGGSTLHDWEVIAGKVLDYPSQIIVEENTIKTFAFKVEVKSMDGGRGTSMNNKIYTALQSETSPYITYIQDKPAVLNFENSNSIFNLISVGKVEIAGKEKLVETAMTGTLNNGLLTIKGSKALKMSNFDIEPPSAMFGQIQTKDDFIVHFEFQYFKTIQK